LPSAASLVHGIIAVQMATNAVNDETSPFCSLPDTTVEPPCALALMKTIYGKYRIAGSDGYFDPTLQSRQTVGIAQ